MFRISKGRAFGALAVLIGVLILAARMLGSDVRTQVTCVFPEKKPENLASSQDGSEAQASCPVEPARVAGSASSSLFVVLHAFTNSREEMMDVKREIWAAYPDADIMAPNYDSGVFSNASLFIAAAQINEAIHEAVENRKKAGSPYGKIILVGHSIGALLARKAYVYGGKPSPDYPYGPNSNVPRPWVNDVDRIILLAGINRGWSTDRQGILDRLYTWSGRMFNKITGLGQMVMSAERGMPFPANLQADWVRFGHSEGQGPAPVIQLLGSEDIQVSEMDNKELISTRDFVFIPVPEATHGNVIYFDDREPGLDQAEREARVRRRGLFREALSKPFGELRGRWGSRQPNLDSYDPDRLKKRHIVFVVHGIRDYGDWVDGFRRELEARDPTVRVITAKYGYFPMFRFLLFGDRQENVRWFVDQYIEALAVYPNAKTRSFIGHSNGTYLIASALENYKVVEFDRVYLAGSVVSANFPWQDQEVRVIRNDIARDDWVVALFPKLFQIVRREFKLDRSKFFDLGSGGFNGFAAAVANRHEGFLVGGHGAAVSSQANIKSIADFILEGDTRNLPSQDNRKRNAVLDFFSNIAWVVWMVLIAAICGLGVALYRLIPLFRRAGKGWFAAFYGFFVLMVLNTV